MSAGWTTDLYFDCGTRDDVGADYGNMYFSSFLQAIGAPFTERWFDGDHWDHIGERLTVQYTFFMPLEATAESATFVFNPRRGWPAQEFVLELPGDLDADLMKIDTLEITGIFGVELGAPSNPYRRTSSATPTETASST